MKSAQNWPILKQQYPFTVIEETESGIIRWDSFLCVTIECLVFSDL